MSPSIQIKGPVLLLMGPIGTFFARVAHHLEGQGAEVWKVRLPLWEPGFQPRQYLSFTESVEQSFAAFLRHTIEEKAIRHILMYGDFILPHKIAIEIAKEYQSSSIGLEAWVFELGYLRPNYVTLEQNGVNVHSGLNQSADFYHQLPTVDQLQQARREVAFRWRKGWKAPTFIQHALTNYRISVTPHKLQPQPWYIAAQILGFFRKYQYSISERAIRQRILAHPSYFLVVLQVSSDSQLQHGSPFADIEAFLETTIRSFAHHAPRAAALFIKHHPRDRGYNNYKAKIQELTSQYNQQGRIFYFHDLPLGRVFRAPSSCQGCVLINSSVGYQALFHGTPLKALGGAPFNIEGLADQQPLDTFWQQPQRSNRELFRKFYHYTLTTTQINGNFDGYFPFGEIFRTNTLPIADQIKALKLQPNRKTRAHYRAIVSGCSRPIKLFAAYLDYGLHWLAWLVGLNPASQHLFERSARTCLKALGVTVLIDRHDTLQSKRAQIHIANHDHPLDVLLIHGHFQMPAATTAQLHLRWIIPGFRHATERYGHILMDHRCIQSRLKTLLRSKQQLAKLKQLFIFPSGSLQTPIQQRFSSSVAFLAQQQDAVVIPWKITYHFPSRNHPAQRSTNPIRVLRERLLGPPVTVICRECAPVDPRDFDDTQAMTSALQSLYQDNQTSNLKPQTSNLKPQTSNHNRAVFAAAEA